MAIEPKTFIGGLVEDAEMRFTQSGQGVAEFRIAESDNRYNEETKDWETTRALYLPVVIWNESGDRKKNPVAWAELAAGLQRGDRVAVRGKLHTQVWDDRETGKKRSAIKLLADSFYVMPSDAAPQSPPAASGGFGGGQASSGRGFGSRTPDNDPWNAATPRGGFGGKDDEPPF